MRGQKSRNAKLKERARVMLETETVTAVARTLNVPPSTISTWKKKFETDPNFEQTRQLRKEQFINDAWDIIDKANRLLLKKLEKAEKLGDGDATDIGKISSVINTMYDKQALACKEATQIVDGNMRVKKIEDFDEGDDE